MVLLALARLLGLLSLLLGLLLVLLTLLAGLRHLLSASLHLLAIGSVGGHGDDLVVHVLVLLAAHLLDVLLTVLEAELVLHTLERRNVEDIGKVHDSGDILGELLGALLLLAEDLGLSLDVLHNRANALDQSNLLLEDDHLGDLLSQLILVVLLVSKVGLLLSELQLLLDPSILLQITASPQNHLVELIEQLGDLSLELLVVPVLHAQLPGGNLLHQETRVGNYEMSTATDTNPTESLNSLFSSVYVHYSKNYENGNGLHGGI